MKSVSQTSIKQKKKPNTRLKLINLDIKLILCYAK